MVQTLLKFYKKYKQGIEPVAYIASLVAANLLIGSTPYGKYIPVFFILLYLVLFYIGRQQRKKELKEKGLTLGDITNIAFVKDWEVTRKTGITRYCLIEGGLMTGVILFVPISFIVFFYSGLETIMASFANLLIATSASFALSYLTGTAIYFFRWKTNERRFIRLTDPLRRLV
jgi:hypothetical protein